MRLESDGRAAIGHCDDNIMILMIWLGGGAITYHGDSTFHRRAILVQHFGPVQILVQHFGLDQNHFNFGPDLVRIKITRNKKNQRFFQ
jgi:hypothetical protein